MLGRLNHIWHSLVFKIILLVGAILLISISAWAVYNVRQYEKMIMNDIFSECDQRTQAIRLGTHYAMMFNARDDINQIILNMGKLEGIEHIRIYNKEGQIKFSNHPAEVGRTTGIKAEACDICHAADPPLTELNPNKRRRIFQSEAGIRQLGVVSPIYNEPGCSAGDCHAHPEGKKVLGALDVVISLEETDRKLSTYKNSLWLLASLIFLITSTMIFLVLSRILIRPVKRLIGSTRQIAAGRYGAMTDFAQKDEIGQLAAAINDMGQEIGNKQQELNRQKNEYQHLFELVPCIITVQDRNYKLIGYNREFSRLFDPKPGAYCYAAYKGLDRKCTNCPVEKTFEDGQPHYSEEAGISKDGTPSHWIVKTAPMKDSSGEIVGAMEISLDITHRKELENRLERSEKQYYAIFNNIPNPVFVVDEDSLKILDCNESVTSVYGYEKAEILAKSFLELFPEKERERCALDVKSRKEINKAKQLNKQGEIRFVNIRISPSEYPGRNVLLITTSDITKRLEAELQLVQAGKMATLGEMATGVAHELNQPLSVIKTASSFFMKKIKRKEKIQDNILLTMAEEIDSHVDRAANIINHMREFGRKSDIMLERVQVNTVLTSAFEIFSQQLKLREIDVLWNLNDGLPEIQAEAGRLEQVFINLLINARDAIEDKWRSAKARPDEKKTISLKTFRQGEKIVIEVADSGTGIPEALIGKVFEPFFTTKKVGEGTGIGLSISYGIVQDFNGSIQVRSQPGQGACFRIEFPVWNHEPSNTNA